MNCRRTRQTLPRCAEQTLPKGPHFTAQAGRLAWHGACEQRQRDKSVRAIGGRDFFWSATLSLNGILSSALSALQTNQAALRTVSNNVANINTDGYVRRVVNQEAQVSGGQLTGVDIAEIQRVADQFLNQEVLYAQAGLRAIRRAERHLYAAQRSCSASRATAAH